MTTSVQRRRGTTAQHSSFTGLEGELTIDTSKDTAVIHDGATVGGFPLAKEGLENTKTTNLNAITGAETAADDTFLIYDASASSMKRITRAELNNAIEKEPLSNVTINSGSIDGTTIGATTRSSGKFTTLESNSTTTLDGTLIPTSKTLLVTTDIGTSVQAYDATTLKSANIGVSVQAYDAQLADVAGLTPTDNGVIIGNGTNFVVESGATLRTSLGLAIGTDVQAYDADLTTLGAGGAGARTFLGLGTAATTDATAYATAAQGIKADNALTALNPSYTGTLTGGTGVVNLGSGQFYKDASGNVGIGTTPSGAKLDIYGSGAVNTKITSSNSSAQLILNSAASSVSYIVYGQTGANPLAFYDSNTAAERMRIDSSGQLLFGKTTTSSGTAGIVVFPTGNISASKASEPFTAYTGGGASAMAFFRIDTSVYQGGIYYDPSLGVSYTTASDYRLKENIAPMQNALARVSALKPVTYDWKSGGSSQGFIAHELAEVCPQAVTGEKDAVDAEGNPKYQGIDTSFLVATLTKAIQEQQALIENLTTRLNALEGK